MTEPPTLLSALLAFQKDAEALSLGKDAKGQVRGNRDYKYLTLGKLHDAVIPLLTKHQLVWITEPSHADGPILRYKLRHSQENGAYIESDMPLLGATDMQSLGSAITYARRYALLSVLGLVADEDDDGAKTMRPEPKLLSAAQKEKMLYEINKEGTERKNLIFAAAKLEGEDVTVEQAQMVRRLLDA